MKTTISSPGVSRLIEKRSDERDTVKLTNAIRKTLNGQLLTFAQITTVGNAFGYVIWTDNLNINSVCCIELTVVGITTDGAKQASYMRKLDLFRTGTGNAQNLGGGVSTIGTDQATDGAWNVNYVLGASGLVNITVQGNVGDTISWNARITALWSPYV